MRIPLRRRNRVVPHQILNAAQRNALQGQPAPERVPQRVNRHVLAGLCVMEPGRPDQIRELALQGSNVHLPMTAIGGMKNEIRRRAFFWKKCQEAIHSLRTFLSSVDRSLKIASLHPAGPLAAMQAWGM